MMILIAGPYRSGTDDDPARVADNLKALEAAAWPIFEAGHMPMIAAWPAAAVLRGANIERLGGAFAQQVFRLTADSLLTYCEAVLRIPGESSSADLITKAAARRGLAIYERVEEIPGYRVTPAPPDR